MSARDAPANLLIDADARPRRHAAGRYDALPANLPPRGLGREAAAAYIGISPSKFDELVLDGRMPKPIRIDGRTVWDLRALDLAFDKLGGDEAHSPDEKNEWDTK